MEFLKELIIQILNQVVYLIGSIVITGFILGILRNSSLKNFYKAFGKKSIYITGFIGVPIHEMSHAIMAVIFNHKIKEVKLFKVSSEDNSLGYVKHGYNPKSIYQQIGNFFIGIAPILGGILSISILMYFLMPNIYEGFKLNLVTNLSESQITLGNIVLSFKELTKLIFTFENLKNIRFLLFLFLSIGISSHISLSKEDIKGASKGFFIIFLILVILNLLKVTKYTSMSWLITYNIFMINILLIAIIFSLITYIISLLIKVIVR